MTDNKLPLYLMGLLMTVFVVYFNSYNAGFLGDDHAFITNNSENFGSPSKITSYFTSGVWEHSNISFMDHNLYRPVWLLWHFIIYQFAGEQPFVWHLSNLLLHTINGILIFHLAGLLFPASSLSGRFLIALLFLVYPTASHDAMWISGSTELLLAAFFLTSMITYINFKQGRGIHWYFFSILALAGALLTKETGICLLLLLILIDRERQPFWQNFAWWEYLGFISLVLVYLLVRETVLHEVTGTGDDWQFDLEGASRFIEYGATYLRTLYLPWPLPTTFRHPPEGVSGLFDPYLGCFILLMLGFLLIRYRATRVSIGLILLPISIPLLLALHQHGLFAIRILYLPTAGLALLLLPVIERTCRTGIWRIVAIIYLLCMSTLTIIESYHWKDESRWGRQLVRYDPTNAIGWISQAKYYQRNGAIEKAISIYQQAMDNAIEEKQWAPLAENLALLYADEQRYAESLNLYIEVAKIKDFEHLGWTGVGNNLWMLGRLDEASDAYREALKKGPEYFDALYNYGLINSKLGHLDIAISAYQKLVKVPVKPGRKNELQEAKNKLKIWEIQQSK